MEQLYPYYHLHRSEVYQGRLPLWNPYSLNGTPFLANSVSALFSPLRWLLIVFPIHLYFEYAAGIKLLLAGSGIYFFCRRLRLSSDCSALAGLCYLFGGYNVFFLTFPNGFISALLGWGLLQVESYQQSGNRRHLALLSLILAAAYLGGNVQCAVLQHLCYMLYGLLRFRDRRSLRSGLLKTAHLGLAGVLALGLASVAISPFLDTMLESSTFTERGRSGENQYHLRPAQWLAFVQPHYREVMKSFQPAVGASPEVTGASPTRATDPGIQPYSYSSFAYVGIIPFFWPHWVCGPVGVEERRSP